MDWFSGWHWAIVAVAFMVIFGSSRLPGAAKALGSSMNIFKRSLREGMSESETAPDAGAATTATVISPPPPQIAPSPAADVHAQQIADLQRQIAELQKQSAGSNGPANSAAPAPQPNHQS